MAEIHNGAFATALTSTFARLGMAGVCISPGSRNTPLTLAFATGSIPSWVHHDERSAAFFALGLAKQTGRPVGLVCTSGTAAAEYHPAVAEAANADVPLIVMTADRPPELRDVGAPQTIDQVKIYGSAVRWFHDAAPPDADTVRTAPLLALRAWTRALENPAGPVHLNLPFREPLLAEPSPAPPSVTTPTVGIGRPAPPPEDLDRVIALTAGRRVLHVVGEVPPHAGRAIGVVVARSGGVALADPRSGLRFGDSVRGVVGTGDVLASAGALDRKPPDTVVRWGTLPTSKSVWRWLEQHPEITQIAIGVGADRDPLGTARLFVRSDPATVAASLDMKPVTSAAWRSWWERADDHATQAIATAIAGEPFPNEPAIAATVAAHTPEMSALFAGSSMPIRDLDAFGGVRPAPLRVLANRGANGIDGSISTALGIAASGVRTVALVGDVATLHDVGALGTAGRLGLPLTIVVVHNDGGGIFGLLPQADPALVDPQVYERTFGTPHGTDFVAVARAFGLDAVDVPSRDALVTALAGTVPRLVQIRTDRSRIAPLRHRIVEEVRETLPPG